jgi:Ca2+-binding RTX toxin-like protein
VISSDGQQVEVDKEDVQMAVIYGSSAENTLTGGATNDRIYGFDANDTLRGGDGFDYLFGGSENDNLYGEDDGDYLYGGTGNDYLRGGDDNDYLYGEEGNDRLYGDGGVNVLYGGEGSDTLYAGNSGDTLYGEAGDDYLVGGSDDDVLKGGSGDDILYGGGGGKDLLIGGSGEDEIRFYGGPATYGKDTVRRFRLGQDLIGLSKSGFGLSSKVGEGFTKQSEFEVVSNSKAAKTSGALIVYETKKGTLFYNPNGSDAGFGTGGGAIADFRNGLPITSDDFSIF